MFDQIKKIGHTLFIPETLKTLIIDNCELHCAVPFVGLGKALNMTNFSICKSFNIKSILSSMRQLKSEITSFRNWLQFPIVKFNI